MFAEMNVVAVIAGLALAFMLAVYAVGVPLALDWEGLYNPHGAGSYYHNMVVPESDLGMTWNADFTTLYMPSP
jgi:hypothetical protein